MSDHSETSGLHKIKLARPARVSWSNRLTDANKTFLAAAGILAFGASITAYATGFAKRAAVEAHEKRITTLEVRTDYLEKSATWQNQTVFDLSRRAGGHPHPAPTPPPPPTPDPSATPTSSPAPTTAVTP